MMLLRNRTLLIGGRLALAVVVAVIALAIFPARAAVAAEFRSGDSVSVEASETVQDDLYLSGGTVEIAGTVTGDAVVTAGEVDVPGQVEGSLIVAAGTTEITGTIGRSVRAATGELTVSGNITGDLVVFSGRVTIEEGATIGGDLVVGSGDVVSRGSVGGDIRGSADELDISGPVAGNVRIDTDRLRLRSGAEIGGDLRYTSRNEARIADGATVRGATEHTRPQRFYPGDSFAAWLGSAIFRLICALVAGLAVIVIMPRTAASIAEGIRQAPLASFLIGLVLFFLIPLAIVVLLVTLIGIPLALILLALYVIVLYLSQVFLGLALGRILLPGRWDTASRGYNLLAMTIGVIIIAGLRLLPVPFLSLVIAILTAVIGLGAVVVGLRRARRAVSLSGV